jgi:hypothetical protein
MVQWRFTKYNISGVGHRTLERDPKRPKKVVWIPFDERSTVARAYKAALFDWPPLGSGEHKVAVAFQETEEDQDEEASPIRTCPDAVLCSGFLRTPTFRHSLRHSTSLSPRSKRFVNSDANI